MTDGHRSDLLGCYGNSRVETPSIDAFASQSVLCRNAFCTHSVCMPTRASVYTGRYPHVHGVWANGVSLPLAELTLPAVLADSGYATCASGKVHFEPQQAYLRSHGVERTAIADGLRALSPMVDTPYYGFQEVHLSENLLGEEYMRFIDTEYPELREQARKRVGMPEEAHELKWITDRAIDFISHHAGSARPFFCHCSFHELSPPCTPPVEYAGYTDPASVPVPELREEDLAGKPSYYRDCYEGYVRNGRQPDEEALRRHIASCYDQMRFVDKQFGRIVETLKEFGIWDNTIVLFVADHGLSLNDHFQWRHGPFLIDEVIRIPMIWHVPGLASPGRSTDGLIEQVDIMPTILDLCGISDPGTTQGESLRSLFESADEFAGKSSVLIQERQAPDLTARGMEPESLSLIGLRTRQWKLIRNLREPHGELYDLAADPGEFHNLWDDPEHVNIRQEMEEKLLDRLYEASPPWPERHFDW
jgi:arylsulfatase A-like enzyme